MTADCRIVATVRGDHWRLVVAFTALVLTSAEYGQLIAAARDRVRPEIDDSTAVEQSLCQSEYLRVKCDADEVVMVTHARYGRMRISRCVKENFGYVGCSVDVLPVLDLHCSGRRTCSVRVLDDNFDNVKPCHDDLKSYLEVKYMCIRVIAPERQYCQAMKPVVITNQTGFLASITSSETGCGTPDSPWLVQLLPGQRINISLFDFTTASPLNVQQQQQQGQSQSGASSLIANSDGTNITSGLSASDELTDASLLGDDLIDSHQSPPRLCRVYAIVRETTGSRTVTICGGEFRHRAAYITLGHSVEIRVIGGMPAAAAAAAAASNTLTAPSAVGGKLSSSLTSPQVSFILRYEAIGCPEVETPPGGWIKKTTPLEVTFGCNNRPETWKLRCRGSEWIGDRRNCTIRAERIEAVTEDSSLTSLSLPLGFSLVIIVALALLIGLLILAVGIVCLKRLKQQDDFDVDHDGDVISSSNFNGCFSMSDGGGSGSGFMADDDQCGSTVRSLCHRSVNCRGSGGRKMASSLSVESRDLSPYEAAFPVEMHHHHHHRFHGSANNRLRSFGNGGSGVPPLSSVGTSGSASVAGYACMTLVSPDRDVDFSPEAEVHQLVPDVSVGSQRGSGTYREIGSSYEDSAIPVVSMVAPRSCCSTGSEKFGCNRGCGGTDRKSGLVTTDRRGQSSMSADGLLRSGSVASGNAVIYTCSKHRNMNGLSSIHGQDLSGGPMTSSAPHYHSQPVQRRNKDHDDATVKMAVDIGDVF